MEKVYIVQFYKWFKIGFSKNPENRKKMFKQPYIKLPFEFIIIAEKETKEARQLEQLIHKSLNVHRLRGEWFELDESTVYEIIDRYNFKIENHIEKIDLVSDNEMYIKELQAENEILLKIERCKAKVDELIQIGRMDNKLFEKVPNGYICNDEHFQDNVLNSIGI